MPIPFLYLGIAAVTGAVGLGKNIKAGMDQTNSVRLNKNSKKRLKEAAEDLDAARKQCSQALENFGNEKLAVLNGSVKKYLEMRALIESTVADAGDQGLHKDEAVFEELKSECEFAANIIERAVIGAAGGAVAAYGAFNVVTTLSGASAAAAATGSAVVSNATLSFLGGSLGVAGGAAVLGGIMAGPALIIMGTIIGDKAESNLEDAKESAAKADEICAQYGQAESLCTDIRRNVYIIYSRLARLDAKFTEQLVNLSIMSDAGDRDSDAFSKLWSEATETVGEIKKLLDIRVLNEDGTLTAECTFE